MPPKHLINIVEMTNSNLSIKIKWIVKITFPYSKLWYLPIENKVWLFINLITIVLKVKSVKYKFASSASVLTWFTRDVLFEISSSYIM